MIQSRVCSYFTPKCKHASQQPISFFSLPEQLRHRILFYQAEDCDTTNASLYFREKNGVPLFCASDDSPVQALASYSNLRLVSHAVKADVSRCLCSYYRITFYMAELSRDAISLLLDPPSTLLSYCRRLTIVLNLSIPHGVYCNCLYCRSTKAQGVFPPGAGPGSLSNLRAVEHFLPTWRKIVRQLELSPNVSKLELGLICDTEDSEAADLILKPLRALRIAKCTIRLSSDKHVPTLEHTACGTVLSVSSHLPAVRAPFRFLDLPTELRQRILSYTDLVTPYCEVQWSPGRSFHIQDQLRRRYGPCAANEFCSRLHTVYPRAEPCSCFRSPLPFFLVCRTMLADARQTFYASNRFIVIEPYDPNTSSSMPPRTSGFEAARFLTKAVPAVGGGLGNLRNLEIVFSDRQYGDLSRRPGNFLADWDQAIAHAAPHFKKLSLTLYFGHENHPDPAPIHVATARDRVTTQKSLFTVHELIVAPLRRLSGSIDSFFVHVTSTLRGREDLDAAARTRLEEELRAHEQQLEVMIMGSGYDSAARGKSRRQASRWLTQMYVYA